MSHNQLQLKSYQRDAKSHCHDFHQLVLPIKGVLNLEIGHDYGQVETRRAALICANESHAFEGKGDNQFIVADIPIALAPTFDRLPTFIQFDESLYQYTQFLSSQLILSQQPSNWQHSRQQELNPILCSNTQNKLLQHQMLVLLLQLLNTQVNNQLPFNSHSPVPATLEDQRLVQAKQYIEQHFTDKDVIAKAASAACLSPRQLRARFTQDYHLSPSQFLLEHRMQVASQLILHSRLPMQQIADHCGYSHLSAFSDRFQQHFQQSPSQFRRRGK